MSNTSIIRIVIRNEIFGKLIQGIISEMSKKIFLGTEIKRILRSSKSCKPILIDIDPERIKASDSNIDPHIKFQSIN